MYTWPVESKVEKGYVYLQPYLYLYFEMKMIWGFERWHNQNLKEEASVKVLASKVGLANLLFFGGEKKLLLFRRKYFQRRPNSFHRAESDADGRERESAESSSATWTVVTKSQSTAFSSSSSSSHCSQWKTRRLWQMNWTRKNRGVALSMIKSNHSITSQ